MLIIDNFDGGNFERTFRQPGIFGGIVRNIDTRDTIGGSRQYGFTLIGNPNLVDVRMENSQGRLRVDWDGSRPNVTTQLNLDYGAGNPMQVDMDFATSIQIDRNSTPGDINATGYAIFLRDSSGHDANSSQPRQRPDQGIEFFRSDFSGTVDWSRIVFIRFKQIYDNDSGNLTGYQTLEVRAVPEPTAFWVLSAFLTLAIGRVRKVRTRPFQEVLTSS